MLNGFLDLKNTRKVLLHKNMCLGEKKSKYFEYDNVGPILCSSENDCHFENSQDIHGQPY